jgi:hypothetical protein
MLRAARKRKLCKPVYGLFHRRDGNAKGPKYLLITRSFPHSPQVFPQGFSTGGGNCGYADLIDIKSGDCFRQNLHFFGAVIFHHSLFFVQKMGLDRDGAGRSQELDVRPA